jgi:hypothetical protein
MIIAAGKFHRVIAAQTPIDCFSTMMRRSAVKPGIVSRDLAFGFSKRLPLLRRHDRAEIVLVRHDQIEPASQDHGALFAVRARQAGSTTWAISIAHWVSAIPMLGTCPTTAPVEGLSTATVAPLSAATHAPAAGQAARNRVGPLSVSFEVMMKTTKMNGVNRSATRAKPLKAFRARC